MRKFVVNVNGNSYEVEVEEVGGAVSNQPVAVKPQVEVASAPKGASVSVPAPKPAPAAAPTPVVQGREGALKIAAPMPGSIIDVKVKAGDKVSKGTLIAILEAMKMENEILAPQDATVASVNVTRGQQVNSGDIILTLN